MEKNLEAKDIKVNELNGEQLLDIILKATNSTIEKFVKESGMTMVDKKYLIIPDHNEADLLKLTPEQRFGKLLVAIKSKDYGKLDVKAAEPLTAGGDGADGYLVTEDVKNEIFRLVNTYGQARQYFRVIPMGKASSIILPLLTSGVNMNWVDEGAVIPQDKPVFDFTSLAAKKAAVIVPLSNELLSDSNILIAQFVIQLIIEAIGDGEDLAFFKGTGVPFTGLFYKSNTFGKKVSANPTNLGYQDLLDMIFGLDPKRLRNAKWLCHRTIMPTILTLEDGAGNLIYQPSTASNPATLLGFPVGNVEQANSLTDVTGVGNEGKPYLMLGDYRNSFVGDKADFSIKISEEATVGGDSLFERDLSAIRATERVGYNKGLTAAYAVAASEEESS